jgi:selenide,water dikinase
VSLTTQVLRQLQPPTDENLLVGTDHFDDAGVYRLDASTALVVTVDFFPPLVDDPYQFGRIAAANSLSDIYAMGGRPVTCLNIVGFPDKELPAELLGEILRGGSERVAAAGAVIAGGHSVRDAEIKYGLAVTGLIHPDRILTNDAAKPGDVLVLTKPIGSGVLTSAAKGEIIDEEGLAEAIEVMTDLNAGAAEAANEVGVSAVTDITGFGLIGHAHEMAEASGVTIEIHAEAVPLIQRTMEFARMGLLTRTHKDVLNFLGSKLQINGVDETLVAILADAQTSGGLLISAAADHADQLVAACKERNTRAAAIVGEVKPKSERTIVVR